MSLGISPVIQIYNILYIIDLLEYAEEVMEESGREIIVDFLFCLHPDFLDIVHLPDNIKHEAISRLEDFKRVSKAYKSKSEKSFFMRNGVDSTLTRLNDSLGQENSKMIRDFMAYSRTLDQERKQSMKECLPELVFLLKEAGYDYEKEPLLTQNKSRSEQSISRSEQSISRSEQSISRSEQSEEPIVGEDQNVHHP